jgi:hypothetical protein
MIINDCLTVLCFFRIDPHNFFSNWMRAIDRDFVLGNFDRQPDFMGEVRVGMGCQ